MPTHLPAAKDDYDRAILGDIGRVGWSVIAIHEDDGRSWPYTFSVGLYHTLGQPEVLFTGVTPVQGQKLTNIIGRHMRAGQQFSAGLRWTGIKGLPLHFTPVPRERYQQYVGYARWLYHGVDFPLLQAVVPDASGRFPWEPGHNRVDLPNQFVISGPMPN